jgi:hypothetical protein
MGINVPHAEKRPIRRLRVFLDDLLVLLDRSLVVPRGCLFIGLPVLKPGGDDL